MSGFDGNTALHTLDREFFDPLAASIDSACLARTRNVTRCLLPSSFLNLVFFFDLLLLIQPPAKRLLRSLALGRVRTTCVTSNGAPQEV